MSALRRLASTALSPALKRRIRGLSKAARVGAAIAPFLRGQTCVDVGASYYPHGKWRVFLESPRTRWLAVEPNEANAGYVRQRPWPCQVELAPIGLSEHGGEQTLYVTNVDSGSSLLEPVIPNSIRHRFPNVDYFFPVTKRAIDTTTLPKLLSATPADHPVFVKLDTQGTELSILNGSEQLLREQRVLGIELEATLLAEPVMRGAGRLWECCRFLEALGYELIDLKLIRGRSRLALSQPRGKTFLNECDAVFALRQDRLAALPAHYSSALCAFYVCNQFYEDALHLLEEGQAAARDLAGRDCDLPALREAVARLA
jgi:FkbM family methyltransferase